jgi:hypothetical protein
MTSSMQTPVTPLAAEPVLPEGTSLIAVIQDAPAGCCSGDACSYC